MSFIALEPASIWTEDTSKAAAARLLTRARAAFALVLGIFSVACSPGAALNERESTGNESEALEAAEPRVEQTAAPPPLFFRSEAKFWASDGAESDGLGVAIAISGNTVVVGASGDDSSRGSAYVFVREGTSWVEQQKLVASDGVSMDLFGTAVSISGDTAVIGAFRDEIDRGAAYVFVRTGSIWSQQQKLPGGAQGTYTGYAVSVLGDTAAIGAPRVTSTSGNGTVGIRVRTGTTWTTQTGIFASNFSAADHFGSAVALGVDRLLVGAPDQDELGSGSGTGYLFERTGTTWTETQKLLPSDGRAGDRFADSVALSGDTALIGAPHFDVVSNEGAAYVFVRSGTSWAQQQKLLASDGTTSARFGTSVALSGDTALIGRNSGAAYVFERTGTIWTERQKLAPSDVVTGHQFGRAVCLSGTLALVTALGDEMSRGSVYPFISDPLSTGSLCPEGPLSCASGICKDGVCCGTACTATCKRCDGTPGTCTDVTSADDADTCTGANTCDALGACRKKNGQSCSAGSECATGNCSNNYCCNEPCTGGCDVCDATPGTCSLIGAGNPGESPSCSAYLCTGASAACPTPCTSDAGCISTHYCSAGGTCEPRKTQASACNDTAGQDCLQAGCRVCEGTGNGFCVDGRCCDSACTAPCDVCSAAIGQGPNGTCDTADEGYAPAACGAYACNGTVSTCSTTCAKDEHCAPSHYCAAGGTCQLRRAQGEACNDAGGQDCLVGNCRVCNTAGGCVDGFCCNAPCSGACDVCSQALGAFQNGLCGVAPASSPGSPSCMPYLCNGSSPSCAMTCSSDGGCVQSAFCDPSDSRCEPDQQNGESCTAGSQCISGNCVDGFCCNDPCQGTCQACAALLKESGTGNGICGSAESGSDPHDDCAVEASPCGNDGLCDGVGRCRNHPRGTSCGTGNTCSGNLVTGQICSGDGFCEPGQVSTDCAPYLCPQGGSGCAIPCAGNQCVTGFFCDNGECRLQRADGQACVLESECSSGFCIEGICCDTRCDGLCQSCRASEKASGDDDGLCGPAADGTDPHDDCGADDPASCDKDGSCDGSGQCRLYADGTECRDTACTGDTDNGFEVTAYECDGAGTCDSVRQAMCGFFGCAGASCLGDCDEDANCTNDGYCDDGECKSRTGLGTACTTASECQSGFCVDGVCCDGLCAGQCEACDLVGGEGRCTPVTGVPRGERPACEALDPDEPCSQTECDGNDRASCAGYVGREVDCRPASCTAGVATPAETCNGSGECPEAMQDQCAPYACSGDACGTDCQTNENCTPGNLCADGRCVSGATCSEDGLGLIDDAGEVISCGAFRCQANRCLDACANTSECAPGYSCNPENQQCEEVAAPVAKDEGGCGCRTVGQPVRRDLGLLAMLALTLGLIRRRRS